MTVPTPLAIFARAPVAGRAKTRLGAMLGADGAARLYDGFLEDVIRTCRSVAAVAPALWIAGDPDDARLVELAARYDLERHRQPDGDLGVRMAAALAAGCERAGHALVIGTDSPTLPATYVRSAAYALQDEAAEVVLGPSADGGYWIVGVRSHVPAARIFEGVQWSAPTTLAETVAGASREGARVKLLPPWYDVDTPEDLRILRAHLAVDPAAAPATSSRRF